MISSHFVSGKKILVGHSRFKIQEVHGFLCPSKARGFGLSFRWKCEVHVNALTTEGPVSGISFIKVVRLASGICGPLA